MASNALNPLDYEPRPKPSIWPLWLQILALVVWAFILIFIWVGAIAAPLGLILGIVNLFHPLPQTHMSFGQNVEWLVQDAVLSAVCIPLAIWHARWRQRTDRGNSRDVSHGQ